MESSNLGTDTCRKWRITSPSQWTFQQIMGCSAPFPSYDFSRRQTAFQNTINWLKPEVLWLFLLVLLCPYFQYSIWPKSKAEHGEVSGTPLTKFLTSKPYANHIGVYPEGNLTIYPFFNEKNTEIPLVDLFGPGTVRISRVTSKINHQSWITLFLGWNSTMLQQKAREIVTQNTWGNSLTKPNEQMAGLKGWNIAAWEFATYLTDIVDGRNPAPHGMYKTL